MARIQSRCVIRNTFPSRTGKLRRSAEARNFGERAANEAGEVFVLRGNKTATGELYLDDAANLVTRIYGGYQDYRIGEQVTVTASFGTAYASFAREEVHGAELIARADEALYQAKRNGRNRIESYS